MPGSNSRDGKEMMENENMGLKLVPPTLVITLQLMALGYCLCSLSKALRYFANHLLSPITIQAYMLILIPISCLLRDFWTACWSAHDDAIYAEN